MARHMLPMEERKIGTGITLSPAAITILDIKRGTDSRSTYIDQLLRAQGGLC